MAEQRPLSGLTAGAQDAKIAQLEAWQALDPSNRHGTGAGLEAVFWRENGFTDIPYGDARKPAMESVMTGTLTEVFMGDREGEFWRA